MTGMTLDEVRLKDLMKAALPWRSSRSAKNGWRAW